TRVRASRQPRIDGGIDITAEYDAGPLLHARLSDGLAPAIRAVAPSDAGREFVGLGFTGIAHEVLRRQRRHTFVANGRAGDARAVELAFTTSDYPQIPGAAARGG